MIDIILWTLLALTYLFCAYAVAYAMLRDNTPSFIILRGQDPNAPIGKTGAILHGLFWPILFTIKLLTGKKK